MHRRNFLSSLAGIGMISTLSSFKNTAEHLSHSELMPVLFIGHGSPMNGIDNNEFSNTWKQLGKTLPVPKAIIVISAHWLTKGTWVTAMDNPQTIHDFGGFPQALFDVQYKAPGDPLLAKEVKKMLTTVNAELDHDWGLDHGAWSVVRQMYPEAKIPVLQVSIDLSKPAEFHYALGKEMAALRRKGVLVIGSGNMVHNLRMVAWDRIDEVGFGFDWAVEMHQLFKEKINQNDHKALIHYNKLSNAAKLAVPTPDHYFPLLYILGMQQKNETPSYFNDKLVAGSLNMTSVQFG